MKRAASAIGWLLAGLALATPIFAAEPQDQAFDLATVEAAHDVCGFPLSDEQLDLIEQRRQALLDGGGVAASDVAGLVEELRASMRQQVSEGLCKPDGPEARLYKRKLGELGLL